MMQSSGNLCRTAVSSSIAFWPNEPSPCRQMTCVLGLAALAPTANGRSTLIVPNGPELSRCLGVRVGIDRRNVESELDDERDDLGMGLSLAQMELHQCPSEKKGQGAHGHRQPVPSHVSIHLQGGRECGAFRLSPCCSLLRRPRWRREQDSNRRSLGYGELGA